MPKNAALRCLALVGGDPERRVAPLEGQRDRVVGALRPAAGGPRRIDHDPIEQAAEIVVHLAWIVLPDVRRDREHEASGGRKGDARRHIADGNGQDISGKSSAADGDPATFNRAQRVN